MPLSRLQNLSLVENTNRPSRRRLSAFDLPEVFTHILSFLASSQLRYGPSLVSKHWRSHSLPIMDKTIIWNSFGRGGEARETMFAKRLKTTSPTTLICEFHESATGGYNASTAALTRAIARLSKKQQERIQALVVQDRHNSSVPFNLSTFSQLKFLTSLKVARTQLCCFSLDDAMTHFPCLLDVHLAATSPSMVTESSLHRMHGERPWPASARRLRSLVLQSLLVEIAVLDSLLAMCAELVELKLINIQPSYRDQSYALATFPSAQVSSDYSGFFMALAVRCPKLRSIHYSTENNSSDMEYVSAIRRAFPNLSSWSDTSFSIHGNDPIERQDLVPFINRLTTLEIVVSQSTRVPLFARTGAKLHQILCVATHLEHLRAENVSLSTADMDMHRVGETYGLWDCRKLKTFRVRIVPMEVGDNPLHDIEKDRGNRFSRMVYAYLIKCCPLLRDVRIEHSDLRLELEGGLCLLTALTNLESLVLTTTSRYVLQKRDVDWLSTLDPHEQPLAEQIRRYSVVKTIREPKEYMERDLKDQRRRAALWTAMMNNGHKRKVDRPDEEELRNAIWKASMLSGVVEVLEGMREQPFHGVYCWSHLEHLSIISTVPENKLLVKSIRPELLYQDSSIASK